MAHETAYSMESEEEVLRLEEQSHLDQYSLQRELSYFDLFPMQSGQKILDAGCGSGLLSRYLAQSGRELKISACDLSELRLQGAKKLSPASFQTGSVIQFFQSNLYQIQSENDVYDQLFCRYVLEHLDEPDRALLEFKRVLKSGGLLRIVDLDGILFNFYSSNSVLRFYLKKLNDAFTFDLNIGRKLPTLIAQAGFKDVKWNVEVMSFQGKSLESEIENFRQRFQFAAPVFESILGEKDFVQFCDLYLSELKKPETVFFYNKFMVQAKA